MRADRLLSIMLMLQVHRRLTARELAQRLEVSERTIYRDMEALSAAGVPVLAERGANGGWSLLDSYQTNLTGLNATEIQALFITQPARLLNDLGLHQASEAALIKLLAALPAMHRQNAEYVRQRIHIDGAGWFQNDENAAWLPALHDAIWQERQLRLVYLRGDGESVERLVDPLGLVAKGNIWYLVAAVDNELRNYRVSRVKDAYLTELPCTRPPGFDLAAYWEESKVHFKAALPRYEVTVRLTTLGLARLHQARFARVQYVSDTDSDGWMTAVVDFEVEEEACHVILSCGAQIEVVSPLYLRGKIAELAESIVALYRTTPVFEAAST